MPKRPVKPSVIGRAHASARRNPIKSTMVVLALLTAIGATIAQADNLLWMVPSPIPYVHRLIQLSENTTKRDAVDIKIDIANGKKEAAEARIDDLELRKLKAASDEERLKYDQTIRKQQDTRDAIKAQIESLRRTTGGN